MKGWKYGSQSDVNAYISGSRGARQGIGLNFRERTRGNRKSLFHRQSAIHGHCGDVSRRGDIFLVFIFRHVEAGCRRVIHVKRKKTQKRLESQRLFVVEKRPRLALTLKNDLEREGILFAIPKSIFQSNKGIKSNGNFPIEISKCKNLASGESFTGRYSGDIFTIEKTA